MNLRFTLFPRTRAARIRFAVLLAVLVGIAAFFRLDRLIALATYAPREGDIVFQSLPHADLVDAIEGVTHSPWSHCGVLVREDGHWKVAEAIGHVRTTPLALWILRGRGSVFHAYRVRDLPPDAPARLAPALGGFSGRLYDYRYAPDDAEIYCSELVFKAYQRALGLEIGTWELLGDLDWRPHEQFIRSMEEGALPLDRAMITPVALTRSPLVARVHPVVE